MSLFKQNKKLPLAATIIQDHILEGCKQGDALSYEKLYNQYAKAMYNTALRILNNHADAEDVLQDAFIDAFNNLHSFQYRSSFGAWLKKIVVNKSINKLQRNRHRWNELTDFHTDQIAEDAAIDEVEFEWKVDEIKKAIELLADGYRTILSLHLFEDYRYEEIAEMLNISTATVRTQYMRAKQKLLNLVKAGGRYA